MVTPDRRRLADVRHSIWNGDLLLFRRRGWISRYGRGDYSHAGMAAWWGSSLQVLESREFRGTLSTRFSLRLSPGQVVDVFRPQCDDAAREAAMRGFVQCLGLPYGYWPVLLAILCHVPILNLIVERFVKPSDDGLVRFDRAAHCSQRYSNVWRRFAGIDWVPNLADCLVAPNDLGRCRDLVYQFSVEG